VTAVLATGPDGRRRCWWGASSPEYIAYHDSEWGRPVVGDDELFERLCLEGFQSGLSWITILRKRENFRRAFAGFRIEAVARFGARDVNRLLSDTGIVRNRMKIEAAIANAKAAASLDTPLSELVWSYAENRRSAPRSRDDLPAVTPASTALSKDLKKRGFRFVGPTTVYATMQACGLVNDHISGCHVRGEVGREIRAARAAPSRSPRRPSARSR
jgi:DNA-3-methyladenine glycosylase I